ncbi:MAG: hypothetical protein GAK45_00623 [Pseudomonas citronellolis]|nr:MAG: hypothetical protein GAK45_00623 [Pseudomonas citronellolis]
MVAFTIEQSPTSEGVVAIPRIGAQAVDVPFTFHYRDRASLAALYERWSTEQARLLGQEPTDSLLQATEALIDFQVRQLQDIVVGWGFEEAFTAENLRQLVSSAVTVPELILTAYSQAYALSRSGN